MKAQFEEKTYEEFMNQELQESNRFWFPPGQAAEFFLGFDAGLITQNPRFWRYFNQNGFSYPGLPDESEFWELYQSYLQGLPKFSINCFIQYKRPVFLKRSTCKEYKRWNCPYFRYELVKHQQDILFNLSHICKDSALVVYSSPAFLALKDLYSYHQEHLLVEKSNFCEARNLNGHHRYSYIKPGSNGCAHSIDEPIEGYPFLKRLDQISYENKKDIPSNKQFIIEASNNLDITMKESMNPISDFYFIWTTKIFNNGYQSDLKIALQKILIFQNLVNVQSYFRY